MFLYQQNLITSGRKPLLNNALKFYTKKNVLMKEVHNYVHYIYK